MKLKPILAVALALIVSCKPDKPDDPTPPEPTPEPQPAPQPEPQPDPEPITCLGEALGTIKDKVCDAGYEGKLVLVCTADGWKVASNTCVKPVPVPVPVPVPTPIDPVSVSLPDAYRVNKGDSVAFAVKSQKDVTFIWSTGETGEKIWVAPTVNKQYTVTGTRKDGGKGSASVIVIVQ